MKTPGATDSIALDAPKANEDGQPSEPLPLSPIGETTSVVRTAIEAVQREVVDPSGESLKRLLMTGNNPELFSFFIWLAPRIELDLILYTGPDERVRLFREEASHRRVFVIKGIDTFIEEIENLFTLFESKYLSHVKTPNEKQLYSFERPRFDRFFDLFLDATPSDDQDLGTFIKRRREELLHGPVLELDSTRVLAGGTMRMASSVSGNGMEGYFQLSGHCKIEGKNIDLSEVRYGRVSKEEAIIYSIQNPTINGVSSRVAQDGLETLKRIKRDLEETYKALDTPPPFFSRGEIDDEKLLKWEMETNSVHVGPLIGDDQQLQNYLLRLGKRTIYEEVVRVFEENKASVRELNKKLRRGLNNNESSIKNVSGQAFLALLGTIKILHESGVRRIKIPMKLPSRLHIIQEGLDEYIFRGKLNLVKRLVFELKGATANTDDCTFDLRGWYKEKDGGPGVDYLVLELDDILTPNRPVVQEFWKDEEQ